MSGLGDDPTMVSETIEELRLELDRVRTRVRVPSSICSLGFAVNFTFI